jgi:DNA-binding GntR family transcriptional regulator
MKPEIYAKLRERILHLEYEPGSILNEQKLAQEFSVSRTPLRTVLFRLEWEHLIKILPRTGIQVMELELNRIMNVYEARLELEEVIGRMAAERFTPTHFDRLDRLLNESERLLSNKEPRELAAVDFAIKTLFHEAAGNPYLTEMSERLYALTFRLWYFNLIKMSRSEWREEVISVKKELADLSTVLTQNNPNDVGRTRKRHLLEHLERIRSKFFSLSGSIHTDQPDERLA